MQSHSINIATIPELPVSATSEAIVEVNSYYPDTSGRSDIGYHLFRPAIIHGGQIRDIAPDGGPQTSSSCIRLEPGSEGSKILKTVIGSFQGETGQSGIRNIVDVSDIAVRDLSFHVAIPLKKYSGHKNGLADKRVLPDAGFRQHDGLKRWSQPDVVV